MDLKEAKQILNKNGYLLEDNIPLDFKDGQATVFFDKVDNDTDEKDFEELKKEIGSKETKKSKNSDNSVNINGKTFVLDNGPKPFISLEKIFYDIESEEDLTETKKKKLVDLFNKLFVSKIEYSAPEYTFVYYNEDEYFAYKSICFAFYVENINNIEIRANEKPNNPINMFTNYDDDNNPKGNFIRFDIDIELVSNETNDYKTIKDYDYKTLFKMINDYVKEEIGEPITVDQPITVDHIDKDNYKDYIGKFVNVTGDVDLAFLDLTELPIRFGKVGGYFTCSKSNLTTLEGSPKEVGGEFACDDNQLTTLKGAPEKVGGYFDCNGNNLTSLKGSPREVGGCFYCYDNKLTTLKGAPRKLNRGFYCFHNELTSLEGCPKEVGGNFHCRENKVQFTEEDVRAVSNVGGEIEV